MRQYKPLNFGWKFKPDFRPEYIGTNFSTKDWEIVNLPHTNKVLPLNNFDDADYQFTSCYILDFTPAEDLPPRVILEFEGVMSYTVVYFNGEEIGSHKGGYTPFRFDLSTRILRGEINRITVSVDSSERPEIPPFGFVVDYLTYGGIYREVGILATEEKAIDDVFIRTQKSAHKKSGAPEEWDLTCEISLSEKSERGDQIAVELISGNEEKTLKRQIFSFPEGEIQSLFTISTPPVSAWSPDSPHLYYLKTTLINGESEKDSRTERFGFRTIEMKNNGLRINGKHLKIRGLNRHQSFPYFGYAMPSSAQKADAEILKNTLGVNTVRSSHYPPSRHFLDACDELGLLVFNEIPGWQHIGEGEWQEITKQHVREMILRDRNHPSVFIWGVRINESHDNDKLYQATSEIARKLDPTRPLGGVRNFKKSRLFEDVYTYNDFIHTGKNRGLDDPKKVSGGRHPYLVTEHNGHVFPTKKRDQEDRRVEQAYRHLRVLNAAYKDRRISGAIGWCMFDYNTHKDFGSGDRICYHGVLDMFRQPKPASASYASQQDDKPFGFVTSAMQPGEMNNSIQGKIAVMTNSDYVKFYKNETLIGTFFPDKKEFKNLPHPPVLIDDFIGEEIFRNESFSRWHAGNIKRVLKKMSLGKKPGLFDYAAIGITMLRYRLQFKDGYDLYLKYVGNWGSKSIVYKFEGYRKNSTGDETETKEWTVTKGAAKESLLIVTPDNETIQETESWESTRVSVRLVDEFGNDRLQAFNPLQIEVNGPAELIGPELITLDSGSAAFWIRSKGVSGEAKITVSSPLPGSKEDLSQELLIKIISFDRK